MTYGVALSFDPDRFAGLAGFRAALRRFLVASDGISREGGVTTQQYQALLAIGCGLGAMTMKDLSEQLLLRQHAATQMVNRLQHAGLVERTPSPTDGRSVIVALSDKGARRLSSLAQAHLAEMLKQEPELSRSLRQLRQWASDNDRLRRSGEFRRDK